MLATEEISIRPYETGDEAFIAALAGEAFTEFTPRAVSHTLDMVRRCSTLLALQRPGFGVPRNVDVAPKPLRRVGFVAMGEEADGVVMLNAIAVVDTERGRGVGRRLMLAFEGFARGRGAERLELCTADCNLAALDLFYRSGFRLVRRRHRFYERGQNACILVKDLP